MSQNSTGYQERMAWRMPDETLDPPPGSARERLVRMRIAAAYGLLELQLPAHYGWDYADVGVPAPENPRQATRSDTIEVYRILMGGPTAVKEAVAAARARLHAISGQNDLQGNRTAPRC
jgi:hypothetical protein